MLNRILSDKRTYYIADAPLGGGEDDPHDNDDYLAALFKQALMRAKGSTTPNPPHLIESVENILKRVEMVGYFLPLLSRDLQPIAGRILEIPGYSDKRNPYILAHQFEDFDLSVEM